MIKISGNAQYVIVGANGDNLFVSSDYGATFASKLTSNDWDVADVNYTGQYMAAAIAAGYLYTSNDYGQTWTEHTFATYFTRIKYSKTGQYLYACKSSEVWRSDDYGATFSLAYSGTVSGITVSLNGQYVFLSASSGAKLSSDFGVTFSNSQVGNTLDMSYDGKYMLVSRNNTSIHVSSDYGVSFSEQLIFNGRLGAAHIGRNPKYMAFTEQINNLVRISSDYGSTWSTKTMTSPSQITSNKWSLIG
jgi:photosystem II stability/assembly factor-like uncharacterized protein